MTATSHAQKDSYYKLLIFVDVKKSPPPPVISAYLFNTSNTIYRFWQLNYTYKCTSTDYDMHINFYYTLTVQYYICAAYNVIV